MAIQIVMDRTGDTRHEFDAEDIEAVAAAERRFNELMSAGFTSAFRTASGDTRLREHSIRRRKRRCSTRGWLAVSYYRSCWR